MSLFSTPKAVLWPRVESLDLYLDKSSDNISSADINLWRSLTEAEAKSLSLLFSQNKVKNCTVLIPDDVVFTKSFIYDSEITTIDKSEVLTLAKSFVTFKINPDYIDYELIPASGKTIILAHIFDRTKIDALKINLEALKQVNFTFESVSQAISKIISLHFDGEYFLVYPLSDNEYTLSLSRKDKVYLTANLKGPTLDVQKIVNYSNLYFTSPTTKFYLPSDIDLGIDATSNLDKTPYYQSQIAAELKKPANLPLPVLGALAIIGKDISSTRRSMENKKNFLPFIAVFLVTAIIASAVIILVLNKNNSDLENPLANTSPTPTIISEIPTETPVPTVPPVDKDIKIQVLNATDINGQAATLKETLTALGFTDITVGNSSQKLTENVIKLKADQSSASAYFQSQLADSFSAQITDDLSASSTYDAVFYIGTDLSTSSSATSTPPVSATVTPEEE